MDAAKLVFLDSREARAMAAIFCDWCATTDADPSEKCEEWAAHAGLDLKYAEAHRMGNALLDARICCIDDHGEDREQPRLHPDAAAFIEKAAYAAAGANLVGMKGEIASRIIIDPSPIMQAEIGFLTQQRDAARAANEELKRQLLAVENERDQYIESVKIARKQTDDWRKLAEETTRDLAAAMTARAAVAHHPGELGGAIPYREWSASGHATGCTAFACAPHCTQPHREKTDGTSGC